MLSRRPLIVTHRRVEDRLCKEMTWPVLDSAGRDFGRPMCVRPSAFF